MSILNLGTLEPLNFCRIKEIIIGSLERYSLMELEFVYCETQANRQKKREVKNYDNSSQTAKKETMPPGIVKFLKSQFICYLR